MVCRHARSRAHAALAQLGCSVPPSPRLADAVPCRRVRCCPAGLPLAARRPPQPPDRRAGGGAEARADAGVQAVRAAGGRRHPKPILTRVTHTHTPKCQRAAPPKLAHTRTRMHMHIALLSHHTTPYHTKPHRTALTPTPHTILRRPAGQAQRGGPGRHAHQARLQAGDRRHRCGRLLASPPHTPLKPTLSATRRRLPPLPARRRQPPCAVGPAPRGHHRQQDGEGVRSVPHHPQQERGCACLSSFLSFADLLSTCARRWLGAALMRGRERGALSRAALPMGLGHFPGRVGLGRRRVCVCLGGVPAEARLGAPTPHTHTHTPPPTSCPLCSGGRRVRTDTWRRAHWLSSHDLPRTQGGG